MSDKVKLCILLSETKNFNSQCEVHSNSISLTYNLLSESQVTSGKKNQPVKTRDIRDIGSISGSGRSPGEGHRYPPTRLFLPGESQE